MKTKEIVILQLGEVVGDRHRNLRLQVPDDLDMANCDKKELCHLVEDLADEAGVPWEDDWDCTTFAYRCLVDEGDIDPEDWTDTPVLEISTEMVTKAMEAASKSKAIAHDGQDAVLEELAKEAVPPVRAQPKTKEEQMKKFRIIEYRKLDYIVEAPDNVTSADLEDANLQSEYFGTNLYAFPELYDLSDYCGHDVKEVADDEKMEADVILDAELHDEETVLFDSFWLARKRRRAERQN